MARRPNGAGAGAHSTKQLPVGGLPLPAEMEDAVKDFNALQNTFSKSEKAYVQAAGDMLTRIRKFDKRGKYRYWGEFLKKIDIKPNTARQHMRVANHPEWLQKYGVRKTLALARLKQEKVDELIAKHLNGDGLAVMSVLEVEDEVQKAKGKSPRKSVKQSGQSADYRRGYEDGQKADAMVLWALGILHLPSIRGGYDSGLLAEADEQYKMLAADGKSDSLTNEAIEVIRQAKPVTLTKAA